VEREGPTPLDVVRGCFAAWNAGDLDGVVALYAPDVRVDATRIGEGVYEGRDSVRAYYGEIVESMPFSNEGIEFVTADEQVAVKIQMRGVGGASGATVDTPFGFLFTVRDGAVTEVVFHRDPQEANAELDG
jgi:ketosteroid isomerase-like protein